jgi:hypothetical protein
LVLSFDIFAVQQDAVGAADHIGQSLAIVDLCSRTLPVLMKQLVLHQIDPGTRQVTYQGQATDFLEVPEELNLFQSHGGYQGYVVHNCNGQTNDHHDDAGKAQPVIVPIRKNTISAGATWAIVFGARAMVKTALRGGPTSA